MIPFSSEQFLDVFARYNVAVWPAQWILLAMGLCGIVLALPKTKDFSLTISLLLMSLWLWSGLVYQLIFFRAINKAALVFGLAFLIQSLLFVYAGVVQRRLTFKLAPSGYGIIGGLFLLYALAIYPALSYFLGHKYPATPTFGVPCPITIYTFGMIWWSRRAIPLYVMIIPFAWSLIGFSAALSLGMFEDVGLVVAGVSTLPLMLVHSQKQRLTSQGEIDKASRSDIAQ